MSSDGNKITDVSQRELAYRLAWCGVEVPVMDDAIAELQEANRILKVTVAIHRDTSVLWRQRAEDAEAKIKQLEAENVELRERWAAKAHELHTLKQEIAGQQAPPEPRRASDMAIAAAIRRITRGGG